MEAMTCKIYLSLGYAVNKATTIRENDSNLFMRVSLSPAQTKTMPSRQVDCYPPPSACLINTGEYRKVPNPWTQQTSRPAFFLYCPISTERQRRKL